MSRWTIDKIRALRDEAEHSRLVLANELERWKGMRTRPPEEQFALRRQRLKTATEMVAYFDAVLASMGAKTDA